MPLSTRLLPVIAAVPAFAVFPTRLEAADHNWAAYLGGNTSSQYSTLEQITPENVAQLEVAWTFNAGERPEGDRGQLSCNPLIVDGVLYGTSALKILFALDAATGRELWRFDVFEHQGRGDDGSVHRSGSNRGLAYWADGDDRRILIAFRNNLYAIDARTGLPVPAFGDGGKIDLKEGLGREIRNLSYAVQSPGIVFEDRLIVGSTVSETIPAAPGHIRAFDIRTGKQLWRFNTIPHPGEFGYETWPEDAYQTLGGANCWAGMALDDESGLVYCPTGSATFDFYGGDRIGQNLFANSLICLDARTGERVWHFQTVHHDLFDYDLATPPNLLTVTRDGVQIPAVAQLTKTGHVFTFNRVTGEPLFPIEERPVPLSEIPGEQSWPTQPRPTKPAPFTREQIGIDDLTDLSPEANAQAVAKYRTLLPHVPFLPTSEKRDTIVHPAMWGGAEWGGAAADPHGILYFNANEVAAMVTIVETAPGASEGQRLYTQNCLACHGPDLAGGNAFGQIVPTLQGIADRKTSEEIASVISQGRATMPPFAHLSGRQMYHLLRYLKAPGEISDQPGHLSGNNRQPSARFSHTGNRQWLDAKGYPMVKPPWGTLNAIDLNTGEYLWRTTFGEHPELIAQGIPPTGRLSWGGPLVTASGVLVIAANSDEHIRAYSAKTGQELWKRRLPVGGFATPATYRANGKQYIVIACGGGRDSPIADLYVAYALP